MKLHKIRPIVIIILTMVIAAFSVALSKSFSDGSADILQDSFILSFIGLFAGIAIACIAFLLANIEKIQEQIADKKMSLDKFNKQIDNIETELQQDTSAFIIYLVLCFFLIMFREVDIPYFSWTIAWISKQQFISTCEIALILLTFYTMFDIMAILFNIVKASNLLTR